MSKKIYKKVLVQEKEISPGQWQRTYKKVLDDAAMKAETEKQEKLKKQEEAKKKAELEKKKAAEAKKKAEAAKKKKETAEKAKQTKASE